MASRYVAPVAGTVRRLDQGIDYQGKPGAPVVAIGLARVDAVKDDPGGFGKVVYYTLLDGPARGQQVYVGHAAPTVQPGQMLQAGDQVATLQQTSGGNAAALPGWVEVGFAKGGVPESRGAGDTASAKRFQTLLKGAAPAAAPVVPAAATAPVSGAAAQIPPVDLSVQPDTLPDASSTQPFMPPPGSGMDSAGTFAAGLWSRIQATSPDAQLLAQNAQTIGG